MRRRHSHASDATSRQTRRQRRTARTRETTENDGSFADSGPLARLPWSSVGETVLNILALPPQFAVRTPQGLDAESYRQVLMPIRMVCRLWNRRVHSLVTTYNEHIQRIEFSNSKTQPILSAKGSSGRTMQVHCIALYPPRPSEPTMRPRSTHSPDRLNRIDWTAVLGAFQCVVRLDLLEVCLSLVDKVLGAASMVCPKVEYLVLPHKPSSDSRGLAFSSELTRQLATALRCWSSSNGGLRGLTILEWPSEPNGQYNDLLLAVVSFCPRLEYLHGWHKHNPSGPRCTRLLGSVDENAWQAFCSSCTTLHEFSWRLAPLTKRFVEIFSDHMKPILTDLHIDDTATSVDPVDFSILQVVFPMLPGLTSLSLWMPNYGKLLPDSNGTFDSLVHSVALNCPLLERFRCFFPRSLDQATVAMGDSLSRLVRGSVMREVVVSPISVQRDGLVSLLRTRIAQDTRRKCRIELSHLGSIHEPIHALLGFLQTTAPTALGRIRLTLEVSSPDGAGDFRAAREMPRLGEQEAADRVATVRTVHRNAISVFEVATNRLEDQRDGCVYSGLKMSLT